MRSGDVRGALGIGCVFLALTFGASGCARTRLQQIQQRGYLTCGVSPGVQGFASIDSAGRYAGFDVDVCRALAAAIFGTPEHVRFTQAPSIDAFLRTGEVDVVSRRLTWSLPREGLGVLFGPVVFYDGQGFLVPQKAGARTVRELADVPICVVAGTANEFNLNAYFQSHTLALVKVPVRTIDEAREEFAHGRCGALSADLSELGAVRTTAPDPDALIILPEQISKEPLAPLVRQDDVRFFQIVRWTIFALIAAEELGVSSANVTEMTGSGNLDVRRFLGIAPGNGRALGLDEQWAMHVIQAVGNYGELFDRNVGRRSSIRLERGLNALWTDGGLMYAPLLRQ